jgi:hypothetical protein
VFGIVRPARIEGKIWQKPSKTSKKENQYNDLRLRIYEKGPFNINLKIKRPDTPLVEGKKE